MKKLSIVPPLHVIVILLVAFAPQVFDMFALRAILKPVQLLSLQSLRLTPNQGGTAPQGEPPLVVGIPLKRHSYMGESDFFDEVHVCHDLHFLLREMCGRKQHLRIDTSRSPDSNCSWETMG